MTLFRNTTVLALAVLAATAASAASFTAQAQSPGAGAKQALQDRLLKADANADGYIDRAEANASLPRIAKNFARLDGDEDGRLSPEELKAVAQRAAELRR